MKIDAYIVDRGVSLVKKSDALVENHVCISNMEIEHI